MGFLSLVLCTVGRCMDLVCFMLDVNFWVVHSLVRLLFAMISLVNSLPALLGRVLAQCWDAILLCALNVSLAAWSALAALGAVLGAVLGGVTHVLLQGRELAQQAVVSGHWALWQICEAGTITLSLVRCVLHSATCRLQLLAQGMCSAAVALWEAVADTLLCTLHLALELPALLWAPCCLVLDFLCALAHVFLSTFLLDLYGLVFIVAMVTTTVLCVRPAPAYRALHYIRSGPALGHLQGALQRLQLLALERSQAVAELYVRRRAVWQDSYTQWRRGGASQPLASRPAGRSSRAGTRDTPGPSVALPCSSMDTAAEKQVPGERPPVESLLKQLREQEERKSCVICHDRAKSVLLLPCRHLCLCQGCARLLLRLPAYQHNCPLCRRMILQTMDVYV